jgi:hypothetical protein
MTLDWTVLLILDASLLVIATLLIAIAFLRG